MKKIQIGEYGFELSDVAFDMAIKMLDSVSDVATHGLGRCEKLEADLSTNPKPPTVEISLEDAQELRSVLRGHKALYYVELLNAAISKAEGKDNPKEDEWDRLNRLRGFITPKEPEKSQVLWQQMEQLKDEMLQFKCDVVKDIKVFELNMSEVAKEIKSLKDTIFQIQTRLSEVASTVSKSNLSAHIRLGGGEPINL